MTRTPVHPHEPDEPHDAGERRDAHTCERAEGHRVATTFAAVDAHHVDADEVNDATYDDDVDDDDTPAVRPAPVRDREQGTR